MSEPKVGHPLYWKVKAAARGLQAANAELQLAQANRDAALADFTNVFTEAGLDPKGQYDLFDADESIRPKA